MTRWYRAYEGTVTDAKLGEAALVAECSRSVAIAAWHSILESCASTNDGGRFVATARRVAVILCEPVKVIEALFSEFRSLGMLDGDVVAAWARRQFESDSSTERSRKHRATSRNVAEPSLGRGATPPETETETETEIPEANASGATEPVVVQGQLYPIDPTERLWAEGVDCLKATGCTDREARSNIGRWLKSTDPPRLLDAIRRARDMGSKDPIALVTRLLSPKLDQPKDGVGAAIRTFREGKIVLGDAPGPLLAAPGG